MSMKAFFVLGCVMMLSCAHTGPVVDPCFTPGGNCLSSVISEIAKAKSEILIQAPSLSAKPVADALIKAKEAGVKVEIILDKGAPAAQNNAVFFYSLNGIPTHLDARHAAADNNVIIIDKGTVISGSFKFTKEEEDRNAENVMIVRAAEVAASYRENWVQHKEHADTFKALEEERPRHDPPAVKKIVKKKKRSK